MKPNDPNISRSELVRQRRNSRKRPAQAAWTYTSQTPRLRQTQTPRPRPNPAARFLPTAPAAPRKSNSRQRYDMAFSLADARVRAPAIALPYIGTRWFSGLLMGLLIFALYTLWNSPTFTVTEAAASGNLRISQMEINGAVDALGGPIFLAVPAEIEEALRNKFTDFSSVSVGVEFPNRVVIQVAERIPIIAWNQFGREFWVDADGIAFEKRGEANVLITIYANSAPPEVPVEAGTPVYARPFITTEMVEASAALFPYLPAGTPMNYDPHYGLGWQDGRGWFVFFGQSIGNIPQKLAAYQAIVDELVRSNIQPALISMEYPSAPYYRMQP